MKRILIDDRLSKTAVPAGKDSLQKMLKKLDSIESSGLLVFYNDMNLIKHKDPEMVLMRIRPIPAPGESLATWRQSQILFHGQLYKRRVRNGHAEIRIREQSIPQ